MVGGLTYRPYLFPQETNMTGQEMLHIWTYEPQRKP